MAATIEIPAEFVEAICQGMKQAGDDVTNHEDIIQQYEASQTANNPELGPALAAYMSAITCEVTADGSICKFTRTYPEDETAKTLEEGTHPVLGGDSGTVHHLGGGTSYSNVPEKFWGTPAEWLAIQPIMIKENISKQDQTLVPQGGNNAASANKDMLLPSAKEYISSMLGGMLQ